MKKNFVAIALFGILIHLVGCLNPPPHYIPDPQPDEKFSKFRIITLEMPDYKIFSEYKPQSGQMWLGWDRSRKAFLAASTELAIERSLGAGFEEDFTDVELIQWAVAWAGGNINAPCCYGLNWDISILAIIKEASFITNPDVVGFTEHRIEYTQDPGPEPQRVPSFSYILRERIINITNSDPYYTTTYITSTAIHELGHAREIIGDDGDPVNWPQGIQPPHGGADPNYCIMRPGIKPPTMNQVYNAADYNNPYFCQSHREFLKTITWGTW